MSSFTAYICKISFFIDPSAQVNSYFLPLNSTQNTHALYNLRWIPLAMKGQSSIHLPVWLYCRCTCTLYVHSTNCTCTANGATVFDIRKYRLHVESVLYRSKHAVISPEHIYLHVQYSTLFLHFC